MRIPRGLLVVIGLSSALAGCARTNGPTAGTPDGARWDPFLDTLQERTLRFFLETTPLETGLTPDRYPSRSPSSVAAIGFALTTYPVAVERGLIERTHAARRVLSTLGTLWKLPQGEGPANTAGYRGFFYHFLDTRTGVRSWTCELSTVDTGFLMAGVLFCQTYFSHATPLEDSIRTVADALYRRVDWAWAMGGGSGLRLGWSPEKGFHQMTWRGYNEAMLLYLLALGSPEHSVPPTAWDFYTQGYRWAEYYGQQFLSFGPLFGHQYSHCWVDFRGIRDAYMREKGIDYAENSRRATYAQRAYAMENPRNMKGYGANVWGFTACDGPADTVLMIDGSEIRFESYAARGVSFDWVNDDGTIAPCAAGGSVAFAPEICIPAMTTMRRQFGEKLWGQYGFFDAFNLTFPTSPSGKGWFDHDYLGIDQGPIALMIENLRSGFVWETMNRNLYIQQGLRKAGFAGERLDRSR